MDRDDCRNLAFGRRLSHVWRVVCSGVAQTDGEEIKTAGAPCSHILTTRGANAPVQ